MDFTTNEQERNEVYEVAIVGAGISGLATAVALTRLGISNIIVLEKSDSLRSTGTAITLFPNAWRALDVLGVGHKLRATYPTRNTWRIMNVDNGSETAFSTPEASQRGEKEVRVVHRKALLDALAEELPLEVIRFSSKLVAIKTEALAKTNPSSPKCLLLEDESTIKAKVVIGCDGVHSRVAQWLGLPQPISCGRSAIRCLAVFPEGHEFPYESRTYIHKGIKGVFVPLNETELYWAVIHKTSLSDSQDPEQILEEVTQNLAKNFPDEFLSVVKHSELSTVTRAPLLLRTPWDILFSRAHRWNVTVAGDALHPMTPDMAQGSCTALEDAVILARTVFSGAEIAESGFPRYSKERLWRTACVTGSAYLAGWGPQDGKPILNLFIGWFIQKIFYKFVLPRMRSYAIGYDCGGLSTPE